MVNGKECSPQSLLFSNTEAWRLFSPENRNSRAVSIFYIVWRWFWAVFFITFIILSGTLPQDWYFDEQQKVKWFIYFTFWGYIPFCLSQLVNAIVSTVGLVSLDDSGEIKWYMKLNWFLYEISSSLAVVITVMFWAFVFGEDFPLGVDTPVTHGVNAFVLVFLDMWITAMPIRLLHFYLPLILGLTWVAFSAIYDFAGGENALLEPYIYKVFDWSADPTSPGIFTAIAVGAVLVIHAILFGLHKLRIFIYSKCLPNSSLPLGVKKQKDIDYGQRLESY